LLAKGAKKALVEKGVLLALESGRSLSLWRGLEMIEERQARRQAEETGL
jgi:hypothetical protein